MMRHLRKSTVPAGFLAVLVGSMLAGTSSVDAFESGAGPDTSAPGETTRSRERGHRRDPSGIGRRDAEQQQVDAMIDRLRDFRRQRVGIVPADPADLQAPPPSAPTERPVAWLELQDTVAGMQAYLTSVSGNSSFSAFVDAATQEAGSALKSLTRLDTDFGGAMTDLGASVDWLIVARDTTNDPLEATFADTTLASLGKVAELMARDALTRLESAGFSSGIILEAVSMLEQGVGAIEAGDYGGAIPLFEGPTNYAESAVFDMDKFEDNIRNRFGPQSVGYSYAIAHNGVLVRHSGSSGCGLARTLADQPVRNQRSDKEVNIASISKTITAMTVLQLLDEKGISIDAPIDPWLPADWTRGNGIVPSGNTMGVTFRNLLTHRSGLGQNLDQSYRFDDLEQYIADGVNANKTFKYQNLNYGLFRIIIPYLHYGPQSMEFLGFFGDMDQITQMYYQEIVQERVLDKAGVVGQCFPVDAHPTLLYNFPYDDQPGRDAGDWSDVAGSGGWYFSARELVQILAFRRYTNEILSPEARELMDERYLGWAEPGLKDWASGLYGIYRAHGGDLIKFDGCWVDFPNGVQVAVLINSEGGVYGPNDAYQCTGVKLCFEEAWVAP